MEVNILIIAFNRADNLAAVLRSLDSYPNSCKNVFIDGPRNESDKAIQIEIIKLLADSGIRKENIKHLNENLGINESIPFAVDWVFNAQNLDEVLVLEDDCVPSIEGIDFLGHFIDKGIVENGIVSLTNYFEHNTNRDDSAFIPSLKITTIWGWYVTKKIWEKLQIRKTYIELPKYNQVIWGTNLIFNCFFLIKLFITKFFHKKYGKYWGTWDNYLGFSARREKVNCYVMPFNAISNIGFVGSNTNDSMSNRNFVRKQGTLKVKNEKILLENQYINFLYSTKLSIIYFFPATVKLFFYALKCLFFPKLVKDKNYL